MVTKRVLSAGGIVFRKSKKRMEVLVAQHSGHHGWSFPKGHVEKGEAPAKTAHREVEEEVGVKGEIIDKAGTTTYFYMEDGQKVFKTVIFFLMRYTGKTEATHSWEVEAKTWLPIDDVFGKLSFKSDKKMWQEALVKLKKIN